MSFCRFLLLLLPLAGFAAGPVRLPIEVVGADGTTASVTVDIPGSEASRVQSLWLQIHNLGYADMASVQVNSGAWLPLNNQTATVAEPGRSYGGIGGGFATLKLTVPLTAGALASGANTIRFRFNRSDGLASGFRVLAFNFLTDDGTKILPATAFSQEDPNTWTPPRRDPTDIETGKNLWNSAPLVANNQPKAPALRAHCADCHAADGRDLKYFNFSNASVIARSQFHGLSALQGEQIASYIRALSFPNPGRPWNPPYQPGPANNSAAGAGLEWALEKDTDSLAYIFPKGITPESFRPDGNLNQREIPISLQLPDWNHWLPRVHPLDAWGSEFLRSDLYTLYTASDNTERWTKSQRKFLSRYLPRAPGDWSPDLTNKVYSTQLWQLVKGWELTNNYQGTQAWTTTIPLAAAPAEESIPDGPNGMGGTALSSEYFNNAWYEVQILVNSGNHQHHSRTPVDWVYVIDRFRDMNRESHRPEPARLLIAVIKAMQFSDPKIGPDNQLRGWRPDDTVDPRIMTANSWAPLFEPLPPAVRRDITEAMLTAWLDKNLKYRTARYFTQGPTGKNYQAPKEVAGISGGNVEEAAPLFRAAGVNPDTVNRLLQWGAAYRNMRDRLHY